MIDDRYSLMFFFMYKYVLMMGQILLSPPSLLLQHNQVTVSSQDTSESKEKGTMKTIG